MRNKAWRRSQRDKALARARKYMHDNGYFDNRFRVVSDSEAEVKVRKNSSAPTVCSGPCCGNPRKWFGTPTMQEVLAEAREKEQREEYERGNNRDLD